MAEQLGDERETDDVVALQPREHLAGERPGRDPLEQWVAVDQERRLQRLEARDAELVPHARADPAQIEPAVAHHAHDARLRIGHVVSRCIEDDVDAELSARDLLDLRGEVLGDRRVRVAARIARAEAEHDGRVRASRPCRRPHARDPTRSRRGSPPRRSRRTPLRRTGSSSRRDSPTDAEASHRGWPQCPGRSRVRESRGGGCRLDPSSATVGRRPRRARSRLRRGGGRCGSAQLHPTADDLRRRVERRAHRRSERRLRPDRCGHPGLDRASRPAPRVARDPRRRRLVRTRLGRLGPRPGARAQPGGRRRAVRARARVPPRGGVPERARSLASSPPARSSSSTA